MYILQVPSPSGGGGGGGMGKAYYDRMQSNTPKRTTSI